VGLSTARSVTQVTIQSEFLPAGVHHDEKRSRVPVSWIDQGGGKRRAGHQLDGNHRAAASALSSGRVLKAMVAVGAAL
jgi:hypothetical protein